MSHENIPRVFSDVTASAVDATEDYSTGDYFAIRDFLGFLGESSPKVMDCSLLPNLVLKIYLASDAVLTNSVGTSVGGTATTGFQIIGGTTGATYTLNRVHLTCSVYGIMDGNYDRMVEKQKL